MNQKNNRTPQTKDVAFDVAFKAFDDADGTVEGYVSIFGNIDHAGDAVERGAFAKSLAEAGHKVRFLWQHDRREPIGVIEELREDEKGLFFRARFANTQRGQDARELMKMGAVGGFSIGYLVVREDREQLEDGRVINRIKEIRLLEISEVTFPCNEECVATGVKEEFETRLETLSEDEQATVIKFMDWLAEQRKSEDEPTGEATEATEATEEPVAEDTGEVVEEAPADDVGELEQLKALRDALELHKLRDTLRLARKG